MSHHTDHVPVRTEGSGTRYDGGVWYEPISSLKTVNGIAVEDLEVELERSQLKRGDKVTLEFDGKMFSGVIESASPPDLPWKEHPSSPTHSGTGIAREETVTVAKLQGRKRKSVTAERFEEISFLEPKRQKKFVEKIKVRQCTCTYSLCKTVKLVIDVSPLFSRRYAQPLTSPCCP